MLTFIHVYASCNAVNLRNVLLISGNIFDKFQYAYEILQSFRLLSTVLLVLRNRPSFFGQVSEIYLF